MGLIDNLTSIIVEDWYGAQGDLFLEQKAEVHALQALLSLRLIQGNLSRVFKSITEQLHVSGDDFGPDMQEYVLLWLMNIPGLSKEWKSIFQDKLLSSSLPPTQVAKFTRSSK
jgi:hypothetical protein